MRAAHKTLGLSRVAEFSQVVVVCMPDSHVNTHVSRYAQLTPLLVDRSRNHHTMNAAYFVGTAGLPVGYSVDNFTHGATAQENIGRVMKSTSYESDHHGLIMTRYTVDLNRGFS